MKERYKKNRVSPHVVINTIQLLLLDFHPVIRMAMMIVLEKEDPSAGSGSGMLSKWMDVNRFVHERFFYK